LFFLALPLSAQQYKIAVVSGLHAHVWAPLKIMLKGDKVKLVGFAETVPELVAQVNAVLPKYQELLKQLAAAGLYPKVPKEVK